MAVKSKAKNNDIAETIPETEATENPIPEVLPEEENSSPESEDVPEVPQEPVNPFTDNITRGFAEQFLIYVNRLVEYNGKLAAAERQAKDAVWTPNKLLATAKEKREEDNEVEALVSEYEKLNEAVALAKRKIAEHMAQKLEVSVEPEKVEPSPEEKNKIKAEVRQPAVDLAKMLGSMAELTPDKELKEQISEFLKANPIPEVGRAGSWSVVGASGSSTRKYRIDITGRSLSTGEEVLSEKGITNTILAAKKIANHTPPDPEAFRKAWEDGGKKSGIQLEHDGVMYTISER